MSKNTKTEEKGNYRITIAFILGIVVVFICCNIFQPALRTKLGKIEFKNGGIYYVAGHSEKNLTYNKQYNVYFEGDSLNWWSEPCKYEDANAKIERMFKDTNTNALMYFYNHNGKIIFKNCSRKDKVLGEYIGNKYCDPIIYIYKPTNDLDYTYEFNSSTLNHELMHHVYSYDNLQKDKDLNKLWDMVDNRKNRTENDYENMNEFFAYRMDDLLVPNNKWYDQEIRDCCNLDLDDEKFNDENQRNQYYNLLHKIEKKVNKIIA